MTSPLPTGPAPRPAAAGGTLQVPAVALPVAVGRHVSARVLGVAQGVVDLAVAGGRLTARTDVALRPGETLRLQVDRVGADSAVLRLVARTPASEVPAQARGAAPFPPGPAGAAAGPVAALRAAGVPAAAAQALLVARAEAGMAPLTGERAAAVAARAASAGVSTPAQAAAFARLEAAGLPATRAAVAGLASLAEGPRLGRALTTLVDMTRMAPAPPSRGGAAGPVARAAVPALPAPQTAALPAQAGRAAAPGPAAGAAPAALPAPSAPSGGSLPAAPIPAEPAAGATPAPSPSASAAPAAGTPAALGAALGDLTDALARAVVDGRAGELRGAVAALGAGGIGAEGARAGDAPVRALLTALAGHPAADAGVARAAAALAEAVGAQPLAAATPGAAGAPAVPPTALAGAYLQLPLPGGGTAEVRVDPEAGDGGGDGERGGRRTVAFLLDLSALGPVMITAGVGPGGVEAAVRATGDAARAHLAAEAPALERALAADGAPARVRVEPAGRPVPERLVAPPPATGLDRRA